MLLAHDKIAWSYRGNLCFAALRIFFAENEKSIASGGDIVELFKRNTTEMELWAKQQLCQSGEPVGWAANRT